ncbi:MAG: RsmD family RNA methyltransferase, partial [Desulfobulbaceae bacterium]|nr:RsmD family RNA methyltransferase [Desulfobulbaceae bacterium]
MRITGGEIRGRKLSGPKESESHFLRPTSDRVREAIFNILGSEVEGRVVLDLFSGTGSLGLEALSRGAAQALFVDQSPSSLTLIKLNLEACFPALRAGILRANLGFPSGFHKIRSL